MSTEYNGAIIDIVHSRQQLARTAITMNFDPSSPGPIGSVFPRSSTLLNELRAILVNYTPAERVTMFEMVTEGYCFSCGRDPKDGPTNECDHYQP